jgi:ABC-2 type transport system permease protein
MGIRILAVSLLDFLTGGLLPIPFFPQWLQNILYALPFGSMQTTPFLVYVGYLPPEQALRNMTVQLLWLIALVALGKWIMKNALKKVVVQGG